MQRSCLVMSHNLTARSGRGRRPLGWFTLYIVALSALAVLALPSTANHTVRAHAASPANRQSDVMVPLTTPTAIRSLTPTATHTPTSTASPTAACGPAWRVVSSPNEGGDSNYNTLLGVAAVSPTDIWAVGGHDVI